MSNLGLIMWILVSFGITMAISWTSITEPLRNKAAKINPWIGKLIRCPICLSFWVGILLSLTWYSPTGIILGDSFLSLGATVLLFSTAWKLALSDEAL
tara:strand:- start:471 stop:764 length:294 start_codon:yes stop_codon:yes gene_type:complete